MRKPIYLIYSEEVERNEVRVAVNTLTEGAKLYHGRSFINLGDRVGICEPHLGLDELISKVEIVKVSDYGGQMDALQLWELLYASKWRLAQPGIVVCLVSQDLTARIGGKSLNFCFGYTRGDVTIQSVARLRDLNGEDGATMLGGLIMHELGHVFSIAGDPNRGHTEYLLGMHCTNFGCVMQQGLTREELLKKFVGAKKLHRFYCSDCMRDIKRIEY